MANTLAVGAKGEDSKLPGVSSMRMKIIISTSKAGAVYVFSRSGTTWTQQAYVKASDTEAGDEFGYSVSLSSDGNTLAVGCSTFITVVPRVRCTSLVDQAPHGLNKPM